VCSSDLLHWIKRFILFHGKQHPKDMGADEVRAFLSYLANQHHVATGTQKIALNALAFLYNKYLNQPLGQLDFVPASKPRRLPIVLSIPEVQKILNKKTERTHKAWLSSISIICC
jgi:site-specific recombinase XerD